MEIPLNTDCPKSVSCPQVEQAAKRAVTETMAVIGVDVTNQESVNDFRDDLRFSRKIRKAGDHSLMLIIGLVITGLGTALWMGIKASVGGK